MKKVLVSLLIGVSLLSVGCGGVKTHKEGYLNINIDMYNYSEQFNEGTKIRGKGIISDMWGQEVYGVDYITYMNEKTPKWDFIEFNSEEADKIYKDYNLHLGDYVYFEGILNENEEIKIEYLKVIDSPTEALK